MVLNLSPELEQLIQEQMESGRFSSPEEVIEQALRLLRELDAQATAPNNKAADIHHLLPDAIFPNSGEECISAPFDLPTAVQFQPVSRRTVTMPLPDPVTDEDE